MGDLSTESILQILIDAVLAGARQIASMRLLGTIDVSYKDAKELVTEADKRSDAAMLAVFRRSLDDSSSIALYLEESGRQGPDSSKWIGADPLDGTNHFAAGGQLYSVQAHYVDDGIPQAGVVFQPEVYLPLMESRNCIGRMVYATRGGGAFFERTEFNGNGFNRGEARRLVKTALPSTKSFVACVPVSTKMAPEELTHVRRVLESGLVSVSTGTGGAGGNVMLTIFGGQHVYANFGAGEDLDLIPPQVIALEAGVTVWGMDRRPPVWHVRKQPYIAAATPEIAEQFLKAAGL